MTEAFHDVRLPDEIEVGAQGGPSFLTNVISISSGAEQRNQAWEQSRIMWNVGYGIQTPAQYSEMLDFFYERRGRAYSFRFRDWSDGSSLAPVVDETVATGDGVQRVFHLVRRYGSTDPFVRYIVKPDWDTVSVKVDGVTNTDWSQGDKGTIVFAEGDEPTGAITWSGQFDALVRFDVDSFSLSLEALAAGTIQDLNIIEVRENPNVPPIAIAFDNPVVNANTSATNSLPEATSTQTRLVDLVAIDDGLGRNIFGLQATGGHAADLAKFEIVDDSLYLKAGVSPSFGSSLFVTVTVHDAAVGDNPSATKDYTLAITNVVEGPVIAFSNATHNVAEGFDTTSATVLADIDITSDVAYVLTLTGADAADFDINGTAPNEKLRLKAGVDTSTPAVKEVNVHADNTAAVPVGEGAGGSTTTRYNFTIGLVAGEQIFDTVGDFTFTVPVYTTLEIDVLTPGCGSWGFNIGTTSAPTAPTETYVQNDQGVTAASRWHVEPFLQDDNPDAWTVGTLADTAKMNSFGIGASLTARSRGNIGGLGYALAQNTYPGREQPSGKGGDAVIWDSGTSAGGASQDFAAPSTPGTVTTQVADGADGAFGAGAGGGLYKKTNKAVTFSTTPTNTTDDAGMAGAGSGMYAKRTWTYGSSGSGFPGADYLAPAPALDETLSIRIGAAGVGGAGTVNGGDGGPGRVHIKWS